MNRKRTHLAMIRTIIRRMSIGSWLIELWSVCLVSALLFVAADPVHLRFSWLALFMAIAFWLLDAHVVRQRRLYVDMYAKVQAQEESSVDFSMDTALVDTQSSAFQSVVFARSLGAIHGVIIAAILVFRLLRHGS